MAFALPLVKTAGFIKLFSGYPSALVSPFVWLDCLNSYYAGTTKQNIRFARIQGDT
jgi:hypothetical protein